jgi:uncharacterized protein (DUF302 family)
MTPSLNNAAPPAAAAYGFHCAISDKDFATAVAGVTEPLNVEGLAVLTEIDVQATMRSKFGIEVRPGRLLGACNPPLAHHAVEAETGIGLLLPCHVVVREETDGGIVVGFMDPVAALQRTSNPEVAQVAHEVRARLQWVKALFSTSTTTSSAGPR